MTYELYNVYDFDIYDSDKDFWNKKYSELMDPNTWLYSPLTPYCKSPFTPNFKNVNVNKC